VSALRGWLPALKTRWTGRGADAQPGGRALFLG